MNHAAQSGAQALLTAAKDAVKLESLSFALPCYIVDIAIEIEDEAGFREYINRAGQTPLLAPLPTRYWEPDRPRPKTPSPAMKRK